jgi:choline kinase
MQVVIPAAGMGSRLLPHTLTVPKCLLPLANTNALERLLSQFASLAISEVVIVVGYRAELIRSFVSARGFPFTIRFAENQRYESTNSIYSLWLSLPLWSEDVCLIDSDLVLGSGLLERVSRVHNSRVVIDRSRKWSEMDMKVQVLDDSVVHFSKDIREHSATGEFFGVSRWNGHLRSVFIAALQDLVHEGSTNVLYENALNRVARRAGIPFVEATSTEWLEFDTPDEMNDAALRAHG